MMDDHELDTLLNRLRSWPSPGQQPESEVVWQGVTRKRTRETRLRRTAWIATGLAATALIGVGFGRITAPRTVNPPDISVAALHVDRMTPEEAQLISLANTSAHLFTAVADREPLPTDSVWTSSVITMLWTTRRLLGTPSLDASRQALLQDLELVLVQLLGASGSSAELEIDLAREAIQRRDIVPRLSALRTATQTYAGAT